MQNQHTEARSGSLRRRFLTWAVGIGIAIASTLFGPWQSSAYAESRAFKTTQSYVIQFYPLWFTYFQSQASSTNHLIGPVRISDIYHAVVAINDDTLYASTVLSVAKEPAILTIPRTRNTYSILSLDLYGNILDLDITAGTPGTYALTGPDYVGPIPRGATLVSVPLNTSILIFRIDRHSSDGTDLTINARVFRKRIKIQALSDYKKDPSGGATLILPEALFAVPFKTIADDLIANDPIKFLESLQTAVKNSDIPPLSPAAQALSDRFDVLLDGSGTPRSELIAGAQAAHRMILDNYLSRTGATNWITFTNIGAWGRNVLDRASITEFIQFGNGRSTAAYYHTFRDNRGRPLNGKHSRGYVLTFPKRKIPEAERFWSVTAYTPNAIELVKNSARKYLVARYTPGLVYNSNGSVSIYMATEQPAGVPAANWLPVPDGAFNIMLRVYGPEGSVADETYVPPAIKRR